jgi:hypothetical protein
MPVIHVVVGARRKTDVGDAALGHAPSLGFSAITMYPPDSTVLRTNLNQPSFSPATSVLGRPAGARYSVNWAARRSLVLRPAASVTRANALGVFPRT